MELHSREPLMESVREAGREIIRSEGGAEATATRTKLDEMNRKNDLILHKMVQRRRLLEDSLKDVNTVSYVLLVLGCKHLLELMIILIITQIFICKTV